MKLTDFNLIVKPQNKDGKERILYKNFSMEIQPGQILEINAPSGTGKTTLFNFLAGLKISDDFICNGKIEDKMTVSYCFQDFRLISGLSVLENIRLPLRKINDSEKNEEINNLLKELNLFEIRNQKVENISGGEMQRCGFIRSVVFPSQLLLLDEPFSNQDEKNVNKIQQIINDEAKKGRAVIVINHQTGHQVVN